MPPATERRRPSRHPWGRRLTRWATRLVLAFMFGTVWSAGGKLAEAEGETVEIGEAGEIDARGGRHARSLRRHDLAAADAGGELLSWPRVPLCIAACRTSTALPRWARPRPPPRTDDPVVIG